MHRLTFALLTIICGASVAQAQTAPPTDTIACTGPFARDSSHAKLISAFGPKNVTFEEVDGAEGSKEKASVLFADDPTRRVQIFWHDERTRSKLSTIQISTPSQWVGPAGITIGMTAAQVEKLNGKPFQINGFGWDGGGYANQLGGALANLPGGCYLSLRFEPTAANPLPDRYAPIMGDKKVASSNALMRRSKPMIGQWSVGYPQ